MVGVITGDIINSRKISPDIWLEVIKEALGIWGNSPEQWEIYRGDSFQLEIEDAKDALKAAIQIKSAVKSLKGMDVRMAVGIGDKTYSARKVSESNGSAFVNSGELVEDLKKNRRNLAVRSNDSRFNTEMNLYLKLALIFMDRWSDIAAETVRVALLHPDESQEGLAGMLGNIKQNTVSTRLKRAHFEETLELIRIFSLKTGEII